jgi:hypothetical protein
MKKFLPIFLICFMCQGCSLLKVVSSPFQATKNSVPQSTEKSKEIIKCRGDLTINPDGSMVCSKGFYKYETNSAQNDRKLNFRERIGQFIAKASGYVVWAMGLSILLTMMGLGFWVSSFWGSVFSVSSKALRQVMQGVQNARKNGTDLTTALNASTDEDVRKFITEFKQKNNIK